MAKPRVISLLSGGIDSPVASYLMMKQGAEVILLHFHNQTAESAATKSKVLKLKEVLDKHQKTKLYLIPFADSQQELIKFIPAKFRMIAYRRLMLNIGEKILEKEKAEAFVTGDNLGQVASQTLDNLAVIHEASNYPVLTPLLGNDKEDTIKTAKEIGTYPVSIEPYEDCCQFLLSAYPETHAKLEDVKQMEAPIPTDELVKKAVEKAELIK